MKKYAFPVMVENGIQSIIAEHFGRAPKYIVLSEDKTHVSTIINSGEHMGGVGKPPELLQNEAIDVLICKGLGPRAVQKFEVYGIEVYVGAQGTVDNAINDFKSGKLQMATNENACKNARHH